MMHPLTIICVAFAIETKSQSSQLRSALKYDVTPNGAILDTIPEVKNLQTNAPPTSLFETKSSVTPSSFVQEGSPDSFADLVAKLQADTAAPSSFAEEGSPDSFADLDAKLKQLEEKTKAELAKLQADTAAPSSFVEEGTPDSFADIDAKLKQLEEKTKAELAKLQADTAAPTTE